MNIAGRWKNYEEFLAYHEREKEKKAQLEQRRLDEREAEFDRRLEPTKQRLKNQWLADHPDNTEADFELKAWPYLKANLRTELEKAGARQHGFVG